MYINIYIYIYTYIYIYIYIYIIYICVCIYMYIYFFSISFGTYFSLSSFYQIFFLDYYIIFISLIPGTPNILVPDERLLFFILFM